MSFFYSLRLGAERNILLKIWNSLIKEVPQPYIRLQLNNIAFNQYCIPVVSEETRARGGDLG